MVDFLVRTPLAFLELGQQLIVAQSVREYQIGIVSRRI